MRTEVAGCHLEKLDLLPFGAKVPCQVFLKRTYQFVAPLDAGLVGVVNLVDFVGRNLLPRNLPKD